jgi:HAD superfamily hydrolase (TIGR01509 family)
MKNLLGASGHDFWVYGKDTYHLPRFAEYYGGLYDTDEEIAAYEKLASIEGIVPLLSDLQMHHIACALATSATEKRMNAVLDIFCLRDYFKQTICIKDVHAAKPDPEIFLLTAEKLQCKPSECVAIEDFLRGLQAAKNAHMKCILYKKDATAKDKINTDLLVESLNLVSFKVISSL